jgi:hypothetical protein
MRRIIVLLSMAAALLAVTFPAAAQPLENDNFADAQVVTVKSNTEERERLYSFAAEATSEAGENSCANQWSVWYTFTLTESMNVGISAQTYTQVYPQVILLETRVGLYAADGVTLLQCVAGGALKNAAFTEILNAGTYYVQVGTVSTPNHYRVVFQEPVENDNIADAEELTLPEGNLVTKPGLVTSEANEPACAEQHTVWYKFTLDKRTQMSFYGFMATGDFLKFSFGLYRDDGELTPVDCRHSMITYTVFKRTLDAGTYYLQLGGESLPHFYQLIIHNPPVNDDLRNAKKAIFPYTDYAPVNFATFEPGIETHGSGSCGGTLYHTVWYKFKLTEKMTVVLNADGYIYLDEIPVEDGGAPTHRKVYIDLWRKNGTGKTPIGCINREMPEMRKTLNPGTYFVRLASTKEGIKKLPSYYSFTAVVEPLGMPLIVDQPDDSRIGTGQSATLSVVATGITPMTYQWYTGQTGNTASPLPGATGAVYTSPALAPDDYSYWVRVTNSDGSRDSRTARIDVSAYDTVVYQLLSNGGFEADESSWTVKNKSSDKVLCETTTRPPQGNGSSCAFVFKGGAGENSVLQQQGQSSITEDHGYVRLRAYTSTTGAAGKLKAIIKIAYSDDPGQTYRYKVAFAPTDSFTLWQSQEIQALGEDAIAEDFSVTFRHTSAGGKLYLDDVSLTLTWSWFFRGAMPLPLPAAPEGFRGAN